MMTGFIQYELNKKSEREIEGMDWGD